MSRASYLDPTKSVRLRTPRSGAPTLFTRANRPVSGFPLSLSFPPPATWGCHRPPENGEASGPVGQRDATLVDPLISGHVDKECNG